MNFDGFRLLIPHYLSCEAVEQFLHFFHLPTYPAGGAMRVNGTLYYVLKDHLGSASTITDMTGNVLGELRYYPYGETRLTTGSILTDKLFTGQREIAGLGIYHYQSRFYSPKLGRFLSADSIVPNPFNPQDFNRFAYVRNNPVRYVDPSGHAYCDYIDNNNREDCQGGLARSQSTSVIWGNSRTRSRLGEGGGGGGNNNNNGGGGGGGSRGGGGGNDQDFLSETAYLADNVGAITADIEAVVVDTVGVIVVTEGCLLGVTCLPAIGYAIAINIGVSSFSVLGTIENGAGGVALLATGLGDFFVNETSYIRINSNGGYDVGIGRDTVVSFVNFIAGLVPEANYDAWISNQQLEYDNQRRSGELLAVTLIEFSIPQTPDLWGEGWPNSIP